MCGHRLLVRGREGWGIYGIFRTMRSTLAVLVVLTLGIASACKGPMAKIDAVRDALAEDAPGRIADATASYPTCPDAPPAVVAKGEPGPRDRGCLSDIANALGSKFGFRAPPVDQASAATAAIVLVREGRGDYLAHSDMWLGAVKAAKGSGVDALRLAIARKMAGAAPLVGRTIDEEGDARQTLSALSGALPAACPTYALYGGGADPSKLPAELTAERAACVHQDLSRREGKGASYGEGTFRALEGALALWRETERALRLGLDAADPRVRRILEAKLAIIEPATQRCAPKKLDASASKETLVMLGEVHADAGVVLFRVRDAGADAAAPSPSDASGANGKSDAKR